MTATVTIHSPEHLDVSIHFYPHPILIFYFFTSFINIMKLNVIFHRYNRKTLIQFADFLRLN